MTLTIATHKDEIQRSTKKLTVISTWEGRGVIFFQSYIVLGNLYSFRSNRVRKIGRVLKLEENLEQCVAVPSHDGWQSRVIYLVLGAIRL